MPPNIRHLSLCLVVLLAASQLATAKKNCRPKAAASQTVQADEAVNADKAQLETKDTFPIIRKANQVVYFWPSLTDLDREILRDAFHQIGRRTCITFTELDYKPWYHADRWDSEQPYVIIRKSKGFTGYTDNDIEDVTRRTIVYISELALSIPTFNTSRGAVMSQLVRFMGLKEELFRPDASNYVVPIQQGYKFRDVQFVKQQLDWPFDPESITVPHSARYRYRLTEQCPARIDKDIGAGQRVGLLTKWDAIKLNSMYCPEVVPDIDPNYGSCHVERKSRRRAKLAVLKS